MAALMQFETMTPALAHAIVTTYGTWQNFAASSQAHRAARTGPQGGMLPDNIPQDPPDQIAPYGLHLLTSTSEGYPYQLEVHPSAAPLFVARGELPISNTTVLAIAGTTYPTRTGVAAAITAVRSAQMYGLDVACTLSPGIGKLVLTEALAADVRVICFLGTGHAMDSNHYLTDKVVSQGGAVVSPLHWTRPGSTANLAIATRAMVAMASALLVTDLGSPLAADVPHTQHYAREFSRFWLAPLPEDHGTPRPSDVGGAQVTDPRFRTWGIHQPNVAPRDPGELDAAIFDLATSHPRS